MLVDPCSTLCGLTCLIPLDLSMSTRTQAQAMLPKLCPSAPLLPFQPLLFVFRISATIRLPDVSMVWTRAWFGAPVKTEDFAENQDEHHAHKDARLLHIRSYALSLH